MINIHKIAIKNYSKLKLLSNIRNKRIKAVEIIVRFVHFTFIFYLKFYKVSVFYRRYA